MHKGVFRLGVDIGGTFTDFALLNDATGEIMIEKTPTTPEDPSDAVIEGVKVLSMGNPDFVSNTEVVIHGTTLISNAIIERKGAKTGLITVAGFRDIIEIGREGRFDTYDIFADYPQHVIPRFLRLEVDERILANGKILKNLDSDQVKKVLIKLIDHGVKSIAVCLLHSYVNQSHEQQIKEIILNDAPEVFISLSSEVLPEIKEYERFSTTVLNAYVQPLIEKYVDRIQNELKLLGFRGRLYLMLSNGGVTSATVAKTFPIRLTESGPAAGVLGTKACGELVGINNLLSLDMGGTTAKACLIQDGKIAETTDYEIARTYRFKKGSGIPIKVPTLDLIEIGAGGGSIAKVNQLGLLQVGPESSGAKPGPVCYGLGGREPTVTDADLVLGYLNPDYFLGGTMKLSLNDAATSIEERIAKPLGLTFTEAAWGIHNVVNQNMASAAKIYIIERGGNPADLTLAGFGGAGPVHIYNLAKKLGISKIIVPHSAGVFSAVGFFSAPIAFDTVRTYKVALGEVNFSDIERLFKELEETSRRLIDKKKRDFLVFYRTIDMRYFGQGFEINVPVNSINLLKLGKAGQSKIRNEFNKVYSRIYGKTYSDVEIEFMNLRVKAEVQEDGFKHRKIDNRGVSVASAVKGTRKAYDPLSSDYITYTVYDRYKLFPGASFRGPSIVEEKESACVCGSGGEAFIDDYGNIHLSIMKDREEEDPGV